MDIKSLSREGFSVRAIARMLRLNRRTVKKYLEEGSRPVYTQVERESVLKPYYGMVKSWIEEEYQATKIYDLLLIQGYAGSYETVKRYVRSLKEQQTQLAYVRFETLPGQQAQVDFSDFKIVEADGTETTVIS
ncbi:MAG TPA: hypothetical protein DCS13_00270 [Candidatus Margulisbacteria bacterium]|nr:MAG: hypothetical protein A2X43_04790 [Candidatus Margulisbacteria bacterium GWD2_39_127]HAR61878.1 hypothetical protein [Candidatus Margulisiibacteriota bacterium]